ncbi:MAG: type II toxin-antitoxin system RelE/ParE family toxin [Kiritimatiellales bacterium]|jgi:plasmid stabilization system protein ParE
MAFQIIWSPSARWDLMDLRDYISLDSPEIARCFVSSLFDAVEHLANFPLSGRIVPELRDEQIREVIKRPCRIICRVSRNSIEIVRIWHSARGIPEI